MLAFQMSVVSDTAKFDSMHSAKIFQISTFEANYLSLDYFCIVIYVNVYSIFN